jgi:hypothetical protein
MQALAAEVDSTIFVIVPSFSLRVFPCGHLPRQLVGGETSIMDGEAPIADGLKPKHVPTSHQGFAVRICRQSTSTH